MTAEEAVCLGHNNVKQFHTFFFLSNEQSLTVCELRIVNVINDELGIYGLYETSLVYTGKLPVTYRNNDQLT